jgi:hypothetical protein
MVDVNPLEKRPLPSKDKKMRDAGKTLPVSTQVVEPYKTVSIPLNII